MVSEMEAKEYADSIGIKLFLVSAKENINLDKLVNYIAKQLIARGKKTVNNNKNGLFKFINKINIKQRKQFCI